MLYAMLVVRRRWQMKYWIHPMTSGRETKFKFELLLSTLKGVSTLDKFF